MKFNFKIQQYQTDAVDAIVRVFQGQGFHDKISYIRDRGKVKAEPYQMTLGMSDEELEVIDPLNDTGYKNEAVELSDEQLPSPAKKPGRRHSNTPKPVRSSTISSEKSQRVLF